MFKGLKFVDTWYGKVVPFAIKGYFAKLLGPLHVECMPFAITDSTPGPRHSDLDVAGAHVQMEKEVTLKKLQPKKMSRLKITLNVVNDIKQPCISLISQG